VKRKGKKDVVYLSPNTSFAVKREGNKREKFAEFSTSPHVTKKLDIPQRLYKFARRKKKIQKKNILGENRLEEEKGKRRSFSFEKKKRIRKGLPYF